MSLLPPNQPINDQKLALFLTDNLECLTEYLTTLPDEANKEVLEHLAVIFDVDIAGLNEDEAREYIKSAIDIHKHKGTVYAVKKAINVVFEKAELKEWFDKGLTAGLFDVEVTLKADPTAIYTTKKFQTAKTLINDAKNVRSHLNHFEIKFPQSTGEIQTTNALNLKVGVSNKTNLTTTSTATINAKSTASYNFDFNQDTNKYLNSDAKVFISSVAVFTFALDQDTKLKSSAISTNQINGGAMWQI